MGEIIRKHHISFKNAFAGVKWSLATQPNFRIHAILASLTVIIGFYVNLTYLEWVIIVFTIIWGLSAEMINTSIEAMTDMITKDWKQEAKIAKDVAAGMMLTVAFGSICIGSIILLPKLLSKFFG